MAAPIESRSSIRRAARIFVLGLAVAAFASPAVALDDLSPWDAEKTSASACPALTQIKYPWLSCRPNDYGGVTLLLPSQPAPLACHLRFRDGQCAASPWPWQLDDMPVVGPGPR